MRLQIHDSTIEIFLIGDNFVGVRSLHSKPATENSLRDFLYRANSISGREFRFSKTQDHLLPNDVRCINSAKCAMMSTYLHSHLS